jgi:hypothetical protein
MMLGRKNYGGLYYFKEYTVGTAWVASKTTGQKENNKIFLFFSIIFTTYAEGFPKNNELLIEEMFPLKVNNSNQWLLKTGCGGSKKSDSKKFLIHEEIQ